MGFRLFLPGKGDPGKGVFPKLRLGAGTFPDVLDLPVPFAPATFPMAPTAPIEARGTSIRQALLFSKLNRFF